MWTNWCIISYREGHSLRYPINFISLHCVYVCTETSEILSEQHRTVRCITCTMVFRSGTTYRWIKPLCTKTASGLNQAKCFIELWHPLFIMSLTAWATPPLSSIPMNHMRERQRKRERNINSCLSTFCKR